MPPPHVIFEIFFAGSMGIGLAVIILMFIAAVCGFLD